MHGKPHILAGVFLLAGVAIWVVTSGLVLSAKTFSWRPHALGLMTLVIIGTTLACERLLPRRSNLTTPLPRYSLALLISGAVTLAALVMLAFDALGGFES
ncbi:MAG: hypothetical protein C0478_06705 [Planctomyces sp.]|nr:hypothetical protein [Planctomyces sp.]